MSSQLEQGKTLVRCESINTSNGRKVFWDVLKGIGILCVLYGHTVRLGTLPSRMIFTFHMPLFFLISGILFDIGRIPDFKSLTRKIWRNLLLPYCFFVVGSLLKYDLTIKSWLSRPLYRCVRILHGEGSNSIWFLVCLAMVQFLAWIVWYKFKSIFSSRVIWMCLVFTGFIMAHFVIFLIPSSIRNCTPFMLTSVPAAMVFFATGRLLSKQLCDYGDSQISFINKYPPLVLNMTLFVVVAYFIRKTFDLRLGWFYMIPLPTCVLGIATAFLVAKIAVDFSISRFFLSAIGSRSLYIFSLELPLSYVVSKITHGKIPSECYLVPHPYWLEPLRMIIILVMTIALSYPTKWALMYLRQRFALAAIST